MPSIDPRGSPDDRSVADRLWWYRDVRQPALARFPRSPPDPPGVNAPLDLLACLSVATLWFSQARREALFFTDWGFYNRAPLAAAGARGAPAQHRRAHRHRLPGRAGHPTRPTAGLASSRRPHGRGNAPDRAEFRAHDARDRRPMDGRDRPPRAAGPHRPDARGIARLAPSGPPRDSGPGPGRITAGGSHAWDTPCGCSSRWQPARCGVRADPAPLGRAPPSLRRVVWLVLEELDQRITFEARPTGLELPELDRLRRESLYADAARPPAGTSEVSMPALITGRPVVAVTPVSPHDLELTFSDGKAARWSAHPNVFARARAMGYDTAVIGWHLPYPRVLGSSLGLADWRPSDAHEQARGDTFGQALWNQWGSLAPPANVRRLVSQRAAELGDLAIRTAADDRFGLVLLHLPVPRPPGIYDRATGRLTPWNFTGAGGGYLDNLALADRMIADLRRGLQRAGLDDRTWLVVSAAQWWRASKRYDGQEDHRVPFLVRPPDGGRARARGRRVQHAGHARPGAGDPARLHHGHRATRPPGSRALPWRRRAITRARAGRSTDSTPRRRPVSILALKKGRSALISAPLPAGCVPRRRVPAMYICRLLGVKLVHPTGRRIPAS